MATTPRYRQSTTLNPSGKPRKLHPAQVVKAPTAEQLRPHARTYALQALEAIADTLQRDPTATSTPHLLPNRAQEAPAARTVLAATLALQGVSVGALQRRRGTREPFVTLCWPAGWQPPAELPTQPATAHGPDERSN